MSMDAELAIVKRTLAAAYRQLARWLEDGEATAVLAIAADVEGFEAGDACCPCCQEVVCDPGCPLEPVRSTPETASGAVAMTTEEFEAFTRKHNIRWEQL